MDRLCIDIQLIIYRYLHQSRLKVVNAEYWYKFGNKWHRYIHDANANWTGLLVGYNYRILDNNVDEGFIYKLDGIKQIGKLSDNYYQTRLYK